MDPEKISKGLLKDTSLIQNLLKTDNTTIEQKSFNDALDWASSSERKNSKTDSSSRAGHSWSSKKTHTPTESLNENLLRPSLRSRTVAGVYPDRYFSPPKLRGRPINTHVLVDEDTSSSYSSKRTDSTDAMGKFREDEAMLSTSSSDDSDTDITTGKSYVLHSGRFDNSEIERMYMSSCIKRATTHSHRALSTLISFTSTSSLHTIDLTNAGLGPSGISAIADTIKFAACELGQEKVLRTLNLSGNDFRDVGATEIGLLVPLCKGLESMSIDNNCLSYIAGQRMARAVSRSRSLLKFSACTNRHFGHGLMEGLVEADVILSGVSTLILRDVGLNGVMKCSRGRKGDHDVSGFLELESTLQAFGKRFRNHLQDLQLGWNSLCDAPVIALLHALGKEASREDIIAMGSKRIEDFAALKREEEARLRKAAKESERRAKRKKYEWGEESSDEEGPDRPFPILATPDNRGSHSFLVRLGLDTCGLRDKAGSVIAQFIFCSETLKEVDMSSNHFGPTTGLELGVGIRFSTSLQVLRASFNPFGIEGTMAIVGSCSHCPPIQSQTQTGEDTLPAGRQGRKSAPHPSKTAKKKKKQKKKSKEHRTAMTKLSLVESVGPLIDASLPPNKSLRQLYVMNTCWNVDLEAGNFHGVVEGGGYGVSSDTTQKRVKKEKNSGKSKSANQKGRKIQREKKKLKTPSGSRRSNAATEGARFAVGPAPGESSSKRSHESEAGERNIELPPGWKPAIPASKLGPEHTERLKALHEYSRDTVQKRDEYLYLRLTYPYEAGLLLFENTDRIALENAASSDEETEEANVETAKDGVDDERINSYRSAFTWRCVENEANAYYDTKRTLKRAFEADWAYSQIESLLVSESDELNNIRRILQKNFKFINELFRYESAQEAVGNDLRITLKGWAAFIKLLKISSGGGAALRLNDIHDVFYQSLATGGDANSMPQDLEHQKYGPGLWRFQFMEAIVRLAKLISKKGVNLSSSLQQLIEFTMKPRTFQASHVGSSPGPIFYKDARNFRESHLYYEEISAVLLDNEENLRRLYKVYARGDGDFSFHADFQMTMREWCQFCESCNLNYRKYGLSVKDHRLAFVYSQMCIINPLKKSSGGGIDVSKGEGTKANATLAQITYTDFLEALARLACMLRNELYPESNATLSARLKFLVKDILFVNRILISQSGEDDHIVAKDLAREAKLRIQEERAISAHHPPPDFGRLEDRTFRMGSEKGWEASRK